MFVVGNYTFGVLKQNLPIDQRVVIGRTSDDNLDGFSGTIVGKNNNDICDSYIILLDEPYNSQKAISITEACICTI